MNIKLKKVEKSDYYLIEDWLKKDYIKSIYNKDILHIDARIKGEKKYDYIQGYILMLGIQPIGYAQIDDQFYNEEPLKKATKEHTLYRIDFFIGEEFYLGKGYASQIVRLLKNEVRKESGDATIIAKAEKENISQSKSLQSNGFILDETAQLYTVDVKADEKVILTKENYLEKIDEHLVKYKNNILNDTKDGTLYLDKANKNFLFDFSCLKKLDEFRYIDVKSDRMKKLDSSLVMAMNFFSTRTLNDEMIVKMVRYFFKIKIKEDIFSVKRYFHFNDFDMTGKASRVGVYLTINNKYRLYIEVAYSQQQFKSIDIINDQRVMDYKFVYQKMLKNSLNAYQIIDMPEFYKHYQFYRNICRRQSEYDYAVFIIPFDNESLRQDLDESMSTISHDNIRIIDWHDMMSWVLDNSKDYLLVEKVRELESKYFGYKFNLL